MHPAELAWVADVHPVDLVFFFSLALLENNMDNGILFDAWNFP